jgi:LAGLIDADG DNA endonuclease family
MNNNIMNNDLKSILIGCLLGDAHIGKCEENKAFITFEQTIKHKDYIMFIYEKLKYNGISLYDIKYYTRKDYRYNNINKSIYFKTYNLELLKPFANIFLSEKNHKIIPLDIECHLNPITLAY